MKFRKFAAAAAAVAVLGAAAPVMGLADPLGVNASAAEMKLLTTENLFGNSAVKVVGDGYYLLNGSQGTKLINLSGDTLENCRKNGKLEYTTVNCDADLNKMSFYAANGEYLKFMEDYKTIHTFKLDKAANKLNEVYSYEYGPHCYNSSCRADGYSVWTDFNDEINTDGIVNYSVYGPDGSKADKSVKIPGYKDGDDLFSVFSFELKTNVAYENFYDGKYVGYLVLPDLATQKTINVYGRDEKSWECEISGINKDGSLESLTKIRLCRYTDGQILKFKNNIIEWYDADPISRNVMTIDDGKIHKFDYQTESIEDVFGSNVLVCKYGEDGKHYRLIDLKTDKAIFDKENYVEFTSSDNGKTFLAKTSDGKWDLIDSNGTILGSFDDAGKFVGNGMYAPVVQDGKGWLVDRNMNQVSEKIDAVGCATVGEELFQFVTADHKYIFATTPESGIADVPTEPVIPEEPAKKVEFKNEDANAVVTANEGAVPEGAEFAVKPLADENTETRSFFDLSFVKDGESVQPKGEVAVKLPVPEALKGKDINVYRVETDGKYTKLKAKVEGDFVTFTTSHFSKYLLTTDTIADAVPENPDTGVIFGFAAIAISGAAVLVSRKKHR